MTIHTALITHTAIIPVHTRARARARGRQLDLFDQPRRSGKVVLEATPPSKHRKPRRRKCVQVPPSLQCGGSWACSFMVLPSEVEIAERLYGHLVASPSPNGLGPSFA